MKLSPDPVKCERCGLPTVFQNDLQRTKGRHPSCGGWLDRLDPIDELDRLFELKESLGATLIPLPAPVSRSVRQEFAELPCAICGVVGKTFVYVLVHRVYGAYRQVRCPAHLFGHPDEWGVPWYAPGTS